MNSSGYLDLIRGNRNFRLLWLAQIISEIGDWLYAVVVYAVLLERTGSAQAVAGAVVLQVLPQVFVSPMAGVVNDRLSRRAVMIAADLGRFAVIAAMLVAIHWGPLWPVYVLLFAETVLWAFFEPGRSAILPSLVQDDQELLRANSLASATWSFNLAIGSALGGVLAVSFGRDTVFAVNALSFLVSALLLWRIQCEERHTAEFPPLRLKDLFDFRPMADGFRYMTRDRRLVALLLSKAGLGLMGTHWVVLPIFGERIFPIRAAGLDPSRGAMLAMSLLMGSRGVGAMLGPLAGERWARGSMARMRPGIGFAFLIGGLGYAALGSAPSLPVAFASVIFAHAGWSIIWVFQTTMLQAATEDRFRGRVFSADFACLTSMMALSTWIGGRFIDHGMNVRTLAHATAAFALLPAAFWFAAALPLWRNPPDS